MDTPIYHIIGSWRSGTTLLRSIMDAHPNIISGQESSFVMGLYNKYHDRKNWDKVKIMEFYEDIWKEKKVGIIWQIDKEKVKNDLLELLGKNEPISFSKLCKTVYLNYKSVNEKGDIGVIIDKNPIYTLFYKELMEIYPETGFIIMIRDYRDIIVSAKRNNIHSLPWTGIYAQWLNLMYCAILKLVRDFPEKTLVVVYENMVNNPTEEIKRICDFIKIDYDPEMLQFNKNFEKNKEEYIRRVQKRYKDYKEGAQEKRLMMLGKNLFNPINKKKVGFWKENMNRQEVEIAEYLFGEKGEHFGYKKSTEFNSSMKFPVIKALSYLYVMMSCKIHKWRLKNNLL